LIECYCNFVKYLETWLFTRDLWPLLTHYVEGVRQGHLGLRVDLALVDAGVTWLRILDL